MPRFANDGAARRLACGLLATLAWLAPGRPGFAQTPDNPLAGDPRLERKVALHVEGLPVGELLAELTKRTGIALQGTQWTSDEKVVAFGPARPFRAWLEDVAALFHDRWLRERATNGEWRYVLTRDAAAREYEAGLLAAMRRRVVAVLDEQARALAETSQELARREKDDPVRWALSDQRGRTATLFYATLTPRQRRDLVAAGHSASYPFASLTPEQRRMLQRQWDADVAEEKRRAAKETVTVRDGATTITSGPGVRASDALQNGTVRLILFSEEQRQSADVRLRFGGSDAVLRQVSLAEPALPARGDPYTRAEIPADAVLPAAGAISRAAAQSEWRDRLRRLSEEAGVPVLSDYYRALPTPMPGEARPPSAESRFTALDGFCSSYGALWWPRDGTLLFRRRAWYVDQQYEVPDRWVLTFASRVKARNWATTVGDLLSVLDLQPRQIVGLQLMTGISADARQLDGLRELLALVRACGVNAERTLTDNSTLKLPVTAADIARLRARQPLVRYAAERVPRRDLLQVFLANAADATVRRVNGLCIDATGSYMAKPDTKSTLPAEIGVLAMRISALEAAGLSDDPQTKTLREQMAVLESRLTRGITNALERDRSMVAFSVTWSLEEEPRDPADYSLIGPLLLRDDRRDRTRIGWAP